MTFPTIKSDPWQKGLRRRRSRCDGLWPPRAWRKLVCQADEDRRFLGIGSIGVISPNCLQLIAKFNRWVDGGDVE